MDVKANFNFDWAELWKSLHFSKRGWLKKGISEGTIALKCIRRRLLKLELC